jgi:glycosyltransferase involved in cell wall biosynthesis
MRISLITVCKNPGESLGSCIESVISQSYINIEYIIIDGNSSDGTKRIIKKYESKISKFISERDEGTYDAMNKGIDMASGDIVGFLNSDDIFAGPNILDLVAKSFENSDIDSCYGDLVYVSKDDTNQVIRNWKSCELDYELFKKGWHPPHPTFFVKKDIYNKYGVFDTRYKIGADYALMLKFLIKHKISVKYIPEVFVKMRVGGSSNKNLLNILKANFECYRALRE